MTENNKIVDLFCGCGGLSCGFQDAGYKVVGAFDNWQPALNVYNENLKDNAESLDLSDLDATYARLDALFELEDISGIIGGPPCQDFSSAGKRVEADRADLTEKYAAIVARYQPRFFLMENVPRAKNAQAFRNAIKTLETAGYGITEQIIDASRCGVPQSRKRLITVGFLGRNAGGEEFRSILLRGLSEKPTSMRDYFGDSLGTEFIYRHPRSYARRAVFSIDEPCPTIRGVNRPIAPGYPGHPGDPAPVSKSRPLTTEERAQIQTFEGWRWEGAKTDKEQMIGNAVPVMLAKYVAKAIEDY